MIKISPTARVSELADIEDSVRGSVIEVCDGTVIDSFVKIKPAGGTGDVYLGPHCHINSGTVIYVGNGVHLESHVLVSANCTFAPTNHAFDDRSRFIDQQGFQPSRGGITVHQDVWIGANSVVLDGAVIHEGCVIAAGSVVRGELEPYGIYAGAPARFVRSR